MVTFPLIRPDKVSIEPDVSKVFLWNIPIVIILIPLAYWLGKVWLLFLLLPVTLLLKLVGFPRRILPDWPRVKDVVGELHVDAEGLTVVQNGVPVPIPFSKVRTAVLEHNHIKGEALGPRDIAHNGIATLSLTFADGQSKTIKFLVAKKAQVPDVEFLLRTMYIRGIGVKEFVGRLRLKTTVFKHGRSYSETQALKEELGIESFY